MNEKLTDFLDVRSVRCALSLKRKLQVLVFIRGRKMPDQIRYSLTRAVDDEIAEVGKAAFDLLCETPMEVQQTPTPQKVETLGNVGKRKRA